MPTSAETLPYDSFNPPIDTTAPPPLPANAPAVTSLPSPTVTAPSMNIHPMVTRVKNGIFLPKVLLTDYKDVEPSTAKEALKHPHWRRGIYNSNEKSNMGTS